VTLILSPVSQAESSNAAVSQPVVAVSPSFQDVSLKMTVSSPFWFSTTSLRTKAALPPGVLTFGGDDVFAGLDEGGDILLDRILPIRKLADRFAVEEEFEAVVAGGEDAGPLQDRSRDLKRPAEEKLLIPRWSAPRSKRAGARP